MDRVTGGKEKDSSKKSIIEHNLKALYRTNTGTEFMLIRGILQELEKRVIKLEKKAIKDKKRIEKDWWLVEVKGKFKVIIPSDVRKILGIHVGDFLAARREGKKLILALKISVDKKESVLSKKGEEKMKEALDDVAKGRITEVE